MATMEVLHGPHTGLTLGPPLEVDTELDEAGGADVWRLEKVGLTTCILRRCILPQC